MNYKHSDYLMSFFNNDEIYSFNVKPMSAMSDSLLISVVPEFAISQRPILSRINLLQISGNIGGGLVRLDEEGWGCGKKSR